MSDNNNFTTSTSPFLFAHLIASLSFALGSTLLSDNNNSTTSTYPKQLARLIAKLLSELGSTIEERKFTYNELHEEITNILEKLRVAKEDRDQIGEAVCILISVYSEMEEEDFVSIDYC